jgi:Flp pilus assembly protein TadG
MLAHLPTLVARKGAATVELAVTLPILSLVAFGVLNLCSWVSSDRQLSRVAADAARTIAQLQVSQKEGLTIVRSAMAEAGLTGNASVSITAVENTGLEMVNVQVDTLFRDTVCMINLLKGQTIAASSTVIRTAPPAANADVPKVDKRKKLRKK